MVRRVKIAGAGISGMAAAITLARAGVQVDVFEKKRRVGSDGGAHTEGLRNYIGRDAMEELSQFGLEIKPYSAVQKVVRRSASFSNIVRGLSFYLIERGGGTGTAEDQLVLQARSLGVKFRFQESLPAKETEIVATGPPRDGANIRAAGYRLVAHDSPYPQDEVLSLFDNRYAPCGYICLLPGSSSASLYGITWRPISHQDFMRRIRRAMQETFLKDVLRGFRICGEISGRGYFSTNPFDTSDDGERLYCGEAAGFQDPVAGFGFRYAALTGVMAAQSLLGHGDYRRMLIERFGEEFKESLKMRAWLNKASNEDLDKLFQGLGPECNVKDYAAWRGRRI